MTLLQISEPDEPKAQKQRRYAIGIDLGTTNSLVACVLERQPEIIPDNNHEMITPSVVRYTKQGITVGKQAKETAFEDPVNTLASIKRLMGRDTNEAELLGFGQRYHLVSKGEEVPQIETAGKVVTPIEVSADILKRLKQQAEQKVKTELAGAVITVPAYFDDAQRQATKDAAKLAGLTILRLLNEPTAAAVAYGLDREEEGLQAVFDLGGGTFDVSILRLTKGVFEVVAIGGDSSLGGDDMDELLAQWIAEQAGVDFSNLEKQEKSELLRIARTTKEELTTETKLGISYQNWQGELTRDQFNELISPLVDKTLACCQQALKDAGLSPESIQEVVLVGGATRVPFIRQKVSELFQRQPLSNIDPDQVVAQGAAIQANALLGQSEADVLLLDVIPLSLGLETMGGLVERLIPRNSTIPTYVSQTFTTYQEGQSGMIIHVLQGERELAEDCRSLAKFELTGIPPMKAGMAKIEVSFQVDADGLLNVTARELSTGIESQVAVKPSYGLDEQAITEMLEESFSYAKEDVALRQLKEQQVEAKHLLEVVKEALTADGKKYLSKDEYQTIEQQIQSLEQVLQSEDPEAIEKAIEDLEQASQNFAERRMDGSVREALTGQTIEELPDAKD